MKLMTRDTDYAIRALCFIAVRRGEVVSVAQLVSCLKIPRPFLRKILQILHKEKILVAFKGQGGGFKLAHKPNKISLVQLITIFQGKLRLNECLFKGALCPSVKTCRLKKRVDKIEQYMATQLKTITIASLISKKEDK